MQSGSENSEKKKHVRVETSIAQDIINLLKSKELIDYSYRIYNHQGQVYIPVTGELENSGLEFVTVPGRKTPEGKYPSRLKGSYDLIGSIAVIHRKDDARSKNLAKSIIESSPAVKSVFLDVGISGEFRIRKMKLLAGEDTRTTYYRENGISLLVDLSRVYFSPRLATERMRVARAVRDGERIIDMFAGIGPFSILIAKMRNVSITALDSNPYAIQLLERNLEINKLAGKIEAVCTDSMDYMKGVKPADRIIMNLPHDSSHFLSAAATSLRSGGTIHYYEICNLEQLEERMESLSGLGLTITAKREVHGYSKSDRLYALDLMKIL